MEYDKRQNGCFIQNIMEIKLKLVDFKSRL